MQHTHLRHATYHHHHISTPSKARLLEMGLFLIAVTLLASIMLRVMSHSANRFVQLPGLNQTAPETTARGSNGDPENITSHADGLGVFEQNARALAAAGSRDAFQKLESLA